jgi:hypothetical protein
VVSGRWSGEAISNCRVGAGGDKPGCDRGLPPWVRKKLGVVFWFEASARDGSLRVKSLDFLRRRSIRGGRLRRRFGSAALVDVFHSCAWSIGCRAGGAKLMPMGKGKGRIRLAGPRTGLAWKCSCIISQIGGSCQVWELATDVNLDISGAPLWDRYAIHIIQTSDRYPGVCADSDPRLISTNASR